MSPPSLRTSPPPSSVQTFLRYNVIYFLILCVSIDLLLKMCFKRGWRKQLVSSLVFRPTLARCSQEINPAAEVSWWFMSWVREKPSMSSFTFIQASDTKQLIADPQLDLRVLSSCFHWDSRHKFSMFSIFVFRCQTRSCLKHVDDLIPEAVSGEQTVTWAWLRSRPVNVVYVRAVDVIHAVISLGHSAIFMKENLCKTGNLLFDIHTERKPAALNREKSLFCDFLAAFAAKVHPDWSHVWPPTHSSKNPSDPKQENVPTAGILQKERMMGSFCVCAEFLC